MKYKKAIIALAAFILGYALQYLGSSLFSIIGYLLMLAGVILGVYIWMTRPKLQEIHVQPGEKVSDEVLSHELKRRSKVNKGVNRRKKLLYAVAVIPVLLLFVTGHYIIGGVLALAVTVGDDFIGQKRVDVKGFASENIVRQALDDVFDVTEYDPFGCISWRDINTDNFGICGYNHVEGSDYIKGFYNGLPIEMCDIRLSSKGSMSGEGGKWEDYDDTTFQGFWLICDFGRELSADLRLWELSGSKKDSIKTENEQFNKKFHIESQIPEEAFYILTPHMMEYILDMDKKAKGRTHIRFDRGGKVQIAINTKRNAFEVGPNEKSAAKLREKFVREIRYVTDIIDELRLVDTLYKK